MSASPRRAREAGMTIEEFLQLPEEDEYKLELVRGVVVREPRPGPRHGEVAVALAAALHHHASFHGLGKAMSETG